MALRLIVLTAAIATCHAAPLWFYENGFLPGTIILREARSSPFAPPSIAYGFGSGLATNIAGIKQSTAFGGSFTTGDGQAYGAGIGGADGNVFARGIGYADVGPVPQQQFYRNNYPLGYSSYNDNNYGAAISSAQNVGNYGTAAAQALNNPYASAAHSGRYQTASAQNLGGFRGYGPAVSSASSNAFGNSATSSVGDYGPAVSSAQSNGDGYNSAISASHSGPGIRASTAQTVQQNGGRLQQSGATSINAPRFQAAQSHAITTY